jgi:hypothetical protein
MAPASFACMAPTPFKVPPNDHEPHVSDPPLRYSRAPGMWLRRSPRPAQSVGW